jgi:hypothetical protein
MPTRYQEAAAREPHDAREDLLEQSADAFAACLRSEEGREGRDGLPRKAQSQVAE